MTEPVDHPVAAGATPVAAGPPSGSADGSTALGPVYLHIGLMKSGTTYLQRVLDRNRPRLAEQGVVFTAEDWRMQVRGAEDLLGRRFNGLPVEEGGWDRLVEEVAKHPGPNVISMEFMAAMGPDAARRAAESFPGRRVVVVMTVRDIARMIPAMWQERIRTGGTVTFATYLERTLGKQAKLTGKVPGHTPLPGQNLPRILDVWQPVVARGDVVVVTVPPSGSPSDLLWRRFCTALDIDPEGFEFGGSGNESLGAVSVELVRRLNVALGDDKTLAMRQFVKYRLARQILAARKAKEPSLVLPDSYRAAAAKRANRSIAAIEASDARVIGDLADLAVDPDARLEVEGRTTSTPGRSTDGELLEASLDALVEMVRAGAQRRRNLADSVHTDF